MGKNARKKARRRAANAALAATGAYLACAPTTWVPDIQNAHLQDAARGLTSIGYPLHPPAPVPVHP